MFIIPTGMMMGAKVTVPQWWLWNQIPVTLGNLVGGFVFTGLALYITQRAHRRPPPAPLTVQRRQVPAERARPSASSHAASGRKSATSTRNRNAIWKGSSPARKSRKRQRPPPDGCAGLAGVSRAGAGGARMPQGFRAQDRVLASGGKLSDPEKLKREEHPFDAYGRLKDQAEEAEFPKPPDISVGGFSGLLVTPGQNSYMCRLRISTHPHALAVRRRCRHRRHYGGGYAHVTTRANLQIREIGPQKAVAVVEAIQDLGLCSRGSGADNIRNVTGTPTAGIDSQEPIDTRPYAREWHFHILNDRSLYGLPRKFNVAFDGAGTMPISKTPTISAFRRSRSARLRSRRRASISVSCLGGITGIGFGPRHRRRGRAGGRHQVADAVVRVFMDHGNRTDAPRRG